MHELPVTEKILDIVLKHASINQAEKVVNIYLTIGKLSDLEEEWIQRYFDHLSRGTLADGARLVIDHAPVIMKCQRCDCEFEVNIDEIGHNLKRRCPKCESEDYTMVSGNSYYLNHIEII